MAINNINGYGQYTDWQKLAYQRNEAKGTEQSKKDNSIIDTSTDDKKNNNIYGQSSVQQLGDAIKIAMKALGLDENDKVSFNTLQKAKTEMEEKFTTTMKEGLKKMGVAEDVDFRLVSDGKGGVKVVSSHPDKAKIEQYLKENPKMIEQFNQILTLSNIEQAREEGGYDPKLVRNRIQLESMTAWFNDTTGAASTFMGYAGTNSWFGSGVNTVV